MNCRRLLAFVIFGTALLLFWTDQTGSPLTPDTGTEVESAMTDDLCPIVVSAAPDLLKPTARPVSLEPRRPTRGRIFVGEIFRPPILLLA